MRRTHGAPCWLLVLACLCVARAGRCSASPFPVPASDDWQAEFGRPVSAAEAAELREEVREMVCSPCPVLWSGAVLDAAVAATPSSRSPTTTTCATPSPKTSCGRSAAVGRYVAPFDPPPCSSAPGSLRRGQDTLGGYSLTLVDALDTVALMGALLQRRRRPHWLFSLLSEMPLSHQPGNASAWEFAVRWVSDNLSFDTDATVSVFETNIRVLGTCNSVH